MEECEGSSTVSEMEGSARRSISRFYWIPRSYYRPGWRWFGEISTRGVEFRCFSTGMGNFRRRVW